MISTTSYLGFTFCRLVHFFLNKCLLVSCLTWRANSNIISGFPPAIPYSLFRNLLFFKSIFFSWWKKQKVFHWIAIFRNIYHRTIFLESTGLFFKNSVQNIRPIFIFCYHYKKKFKAEVKQCLAFCHLGTELVGSKNTDDCENCLVSSSLFNSWFSLLYRSRSSRVFNLSWNPSGLWETP